MQELRNIVIAILAGATFGIGLTVAGMTNPKKVLDFLDFAAIPTGGWDPTLGVVFVTVLAIMFAAFALQRRREAPLMAERFYVPGGGEIDAPLVVGSILFGIGWGLVGLCPGPAIAAMPLVGDQWLDLVVFLVGLFAGVALAVVVKSAKPKAA